jgi:hypothetical protein
MTKENTLNTYTIMFSNGTQKMSLSANNIQEALLLVQNQCGKTVEISSIVKIQPW